MALIANHAPNEVTSPFGELFSTLRNSWTGNWTISLKLLFSQPIVVIAHRDYHSDLTLWTIAYYPITLLVSLLMSFLFGLVLLFRCNKKAMIYPQLIAAILITLFSVTYISMLEHCSGPTWIFQVMLIAKNSWLFNPKLYWYLITHDSVALLGNLQWALAITGISWAVSIIVYLARK